MRKRTQAREFALQVLYQIDITADAYEDSLSNFWRAREDESTAQEIKDFAGELVKGVVEKLAVLDEKISQYAQNWCLERMAVVDRNILRLGAYELMFRRDIPVKVAINEAIELSKKYSTLEAGKFVNGILDKIKLERKEE